MSDADPPVTLDTCEREPIHIPGSIQPHGVLLACRGGGPDGRGLVVRQASASTSGHLGLEAAHVLGRPLLGLFDAATGAVIAEAAARPARMRELNPVRAITTNGAAFDAVLHRASPDVLVVELEPVSDDDRNRHAGFDSRLRASVLRLQGARDVERLCSIAATQVRDITGFDRVMVYRFDRAWNGEVIAEDKRDDLEPFLGLCYPASDIPAQARRLYTVNWLRFIGDVAYRPSPITPSLDPDTATPLDLSHSILRSVSPIHIEYLKNMGVTASMSVSLVIDGALWGLIACHHYSGPRLVPYRTRDTAEHLGQMLSWQLRVLDVADTAEKSRVTATHEAEIVRAIATSADFLDGIATPAWPALAGATGAAIVLQEGTRALGDTPPEAELKAIVAWLVERGQDVFVTDHLAQDVPLADGGTGPFAGMLAVAISRDLGEYLLWFRPPTDRTVDWAGDPRKVIVRGGEGQPPRLSPRGSFALWREQVRGRSLPWEPWHVEAASNLRRVLLGGVRLRAAELQRLNDRLLAADRAKDDFIATVSHELRTPLNAIAGWTQILRAGNASAERLARGLDVIDRNARAQTQIVDDLLDVSRMVSGKLSLDVESVDLVALVESVLDGVEVGLRAKDLRLKRVLDPSASPVLGDTTRLRQVVSNLVNNSMKFTPKGGSITVVLHRRQSDVELCVNDTGTGISADFLPHVFDVFRQADAGMNRRSSGLGLGLAIVKKLVELHGGQISAESPGAGLGATFRVRIPIAPVRAHDVDETPPRPVVPSGDKLAGLSCLVVEDEADARDLVKVVLTSHGATVSEAPHAAAAMALLAQRRFDVIVSDIGLPETDGMQLMRDLRADRNGRNAETAAVALTAYGRAHDRASVLNVGFDAYVPKPVDANELISVVASVVRRRSR